MNMRACPRCDHDSPQGLCYWICKPCGIAFDFAGNLAPEGSLDIPCAADFLERFMRAAHALIEDVYSGTSSKRAATIAISGVIAAMGVNVQEIAVEVARIQHAHQVRKDLWHLLREGSS